MRNDNDTLFLLIDWLMAASGAYIKSVERGMIWGHPKPRQGRPLDPPLVTLQPDLILQGDSKVEGVKRQVSPVE
jgi:hypothetical protein